jgi:glycosyltransferase involved in cell wall biosynthesis
MTLVSTIIPAYNAAAYVRETIDSALAQTHREHEIIVVDDGSTDGTWEILQSYGDAIQAVRQPNGGPARARNTGARIARGEWLAFLDADDLWLPEKLQRQLAEAERTGAALVYTNRENFGSCETVSTLQSDGVTLHAGESFERLLEGNFITLSSVLVDRRVFAEAGGFDEAAVLIGVEDWDLWLRIAAAHPIALCREPLTRYRRHPGGISRNVNRMRQGLFATLERAFGLERAGRLPAAARRRAQSQAWGVLGGVATNGRPFSGTPYFLRSALLEPLSPQAWKQVVKSCLGRA